jgi:DNA polymerase V
VLEDLRAAVGQFVTYAGEKLRRQGMAASVLTVFVATNRFAKVAPKYSNSATVEFLYPTDSTSELMEYALPVLESLFREGYRFKKAGITLTELLPVAQLPNRMFDNDRLQRSSELLKTVDRLNRLYGPESIHYGVVRRRRKWSSKSEQRSPRYTTNWNELMLVS